MKKHLFLLITILITVLTLTACSNNVPNSTKSTSPEAASQSLSSDSENPADSKSTSDSANTTDSDTTTGTENSHSNNQSNSQEPDYEANPYYDLDFSFKSEDIAGNSVTSDIYGNADLTLLNIFATWCPPCVEEMPYLSALNTELKDSSFQIIGFCTDLRNPENGALDEEAIATAKELFSAANSSYPYIIPDETFLGGILFVQYFPTSVFIDKNGRMLGEPVVGANSYEGWKTEITKRLEELNK